MNLPEEIMALLKKSALEDAGYINPNFLGEIENLLETYYGLEDDDVHRWIQNMYGM